jgi:prophage regulatory protein
MRRKLSSEERAARARTTRENAPKRAALRAQRRADAIRTGVGTLRTDDTAAVVNVNPSTLWRWIQAGLFPAPKSLGPHSVGWDASTVRDWLASRETAA